MNKAELQKLKDLQDLDLKINELKSNKNSKPVQLTEKKKEADEIQAQLKLKQQELQDLKKTVDQKEVDVKEREDKITKLNMQLNVTKTNKEYGIITKEIDSLKADNSVTEDGILGFFSQVDEAEKVCGEIKDDIERKNKEYDDFQSQIKKELVEIDEQLAEVESTRQKMTGDLLPDLFKLYEKIMTHKPDRQAMALVIDNTCRGCHVDLTPQEINTLLKWKDTIVCRSCSRILYLEPATEPQKSK